MLSYCLTLAEEVGTLPEVILAEAILTGRRINDWMASPGRRIVLIFRKSKVIDIMEDLRKCIVVADVRPLGCVKAQARQVWFRLSDDGAGHGGL